MATLSMDESWTGSHLDVILLVEDLQYTLEQYDGFSIRVYQKGEQIAQWTENDTSWGDGWSWFTYTLTNDKYLGYNYFSPDCTYVVYVDFYYGGNEFTLNPMTFTTNSIDPPDGDIAPSVYVPIRNQQYGTCVANSLACAMDVFRAKNKGITYERFSAAYLFGADGRSDYDGMYFDEGIDIGRGFGSPRYEIYTGFFPDEVDKTTAVSMFKSADEVVKNNAKKQKFSNSANVDFYDVENVRSCIEHYGYFMFNFRVPKNFANIGIDGIMEQPDEFTGEYHSMALIGLTTINDEKYWIAQNSWGEDWGAGGRCFVPYNWGGCKDVLAPTRYPDLEGDNLTSWTCDCYAAVPSKDIMADSPSTAYNVKAVQDGANQAVTLSWSSDEVSATYIILARKQGTERWFVKQYTTSINTENTTSVDVDDWTSYEFMVITMHNYHCSDQSEVVAIILETLQPTTLDIYRGEKSCEFTWDKLDNATGYNLKFVRNYDNYTLTRENISNYWCIVEAQEGEEWAYGVAHTAWIQAYNDKTTGPWVSFGPITTFPKTPTISLSQDNKFISVNYSFDNTTNVTELSFLLYKLSDVLGGTKRVGLYTHTIEEGNPNPSGTYKIDVQCDAETQYRVTSRASLLLTQPDYDGTFKLTGRQVENTITIADSIKPELWTWITAITSGKTMTLNDTTIHPVDAAEWNAFTRKINAMRAYLGYGEYPFTVVKGTSTKHSYSTNFTHAIYEEAVKAIQGMGSGAGLALNDVDTSYLNAEMFSVLQGELNAAIQNLG